MVVMNPLERLFVMGPIQGAYLEWFCYPRVFRWVDPGLEGRALEIGCGPGRTTAELLRRLSRVPQEPGDSRRSREVPQVSLVAVDMDPGLLERARRAAPGAEFREADATHLDFPDGHFDAVFEFNAFHHLDHRAALREAARVLRPGGSFYAADACIGRRIGPRAAIGRFSRDGFLGDMAAAGLEVRGHAGWRLIAAHGVKTQRA